MPSPVAVYVHVPFCPSKCGYCDFNSFAMTGEIVGQTVDAMVEEIARSPHRGRPAKTVFFGGGTPTFLEAEQIDRLLKAVFDAHPPLPDAEVTSEANPGTVDIPKFAAMRDSGFNRISLGAQSFNSGDLMRLGRVHEPSHIARAVGAARSAGFDNINLDLMFALPGQSDRAWRENLRIATDLHPEHLSLYCLTIEPNTRFFRLHNRGMLDLPDDDAQVEMYETACEVCEKAGYHLYEISNFAKPRRECQHNLCYWRAEEYVGYGPGAVGCTILDGVRTRSTNMKHPQRYVDAVVHRWPLSCEEEVVNGQTLRLEQVMLGIRLSEGLSLSSVPLDQGVLAQLQDRKWVTVDSDAVRLTSEGRHFCSEVALALA